MKILENYKKIAQELLFEVDDEKIIKYKDKDGESKEMKAGSAKTMPDEHPAKQAYNKMKDDGGDDKEKPSGQKIGGSDFDRDAQNQKDADDWASKMFGAEKDKVMGKDDSGDSDPSYGKWDDMEDRMFSPDDFDTWLDDSGVKLSDEDKKEVDELMDNWYDLDGDLQQAETEFEMGDDEDGEIEYEMDMIKDDLDDTKDSIRKIMNKYQDEAGKDKDSDDVVSMSSEESIKDDLDQLRDKIKVRGDKQLRNGEVFRQLAQDVEDEYGEEAGIQSIEDLRYISYDIAEKGIENTEEMLKKVLDNLELELQRYNSDVFQSVPGRDPKESYRTIKEQFNRIKRK